jgi:exopolyphosphatase/guanosine-5'-triphosphate,3'-diphosphate pyrophosphatase
MSGDNREMNDAVSENCFASIDIGSHTTRLLIAQRHGTELAPVRTERRVTRLARDFHEDEITEQAQLGNISALKEYKSIIDQFHVKGIACGATGVVRRAKNSESLIERIIHQTGIECRILSEQTEALLSAKGVLSFLGQTSNDLLIFDVGGASTEFLLTGREISAFSTSRPIGATTLTEKYLKGDPPGLEAVKRSALSARYEIFSAKEHLYENLKKNGIVTFFARFQPVGTAGTVTTLAAMFNKMQRYVAYRVNGIVLSKDWLSDTIKSLASMSLAYRKLLAGLEPGREDIILGGAVIVSEVLSCFGYDSLAVSDAGLLEGLLVELVEKEMAMEGGEISASLRTALTWRLQKE